MRIHAALRCLSAMAMLSVYMAIPGCSHVQQVAADACAISSELAADVDAALGTDEYEAKLSKIVSSLCALRGAVEQVTSTLGQQTATKATVDPFAQAKYARGMAWLEKYGGTAAPVKAGLPGHHCCYKPGFVSSCDHVTPITPSNIQVLCNQGCVPIQLWC